MSIYRGIGALKRVEEGEKMNKVRRKVLQEIYNIISDAKDDLKLVFEEIERTKKMSELIEFIELIQQQSEEKQLELYYITEGVKLVAEKR